MPLKVIRRKDRGTLQISGIVKLPDGSRVRVRARAQSDRLDLAREEAAAIEAKILRDNWHGEQRGSRSFAEAVESYLASARRATGDQKRLGRIMQALGDVPLAEVNQTAINRIRPKMLAPDAAPATVTRGLIVPIRAVLRHANALGWCDVPRFVIPKKTPGRTLYLLPEEAGRLIGAAAAHLKPLLTFLIGTGARMAEALELEWRDVDLAGGRAIFWKTKTGQRRVAALPPVVVAALSALPHREGKVFGWWRAKNPNKGPPKRAAYKDLKREAGGHIKTGWSGAIQRAKLDPELTPHDLRHTWASWHYAIHRDLLALKVEGGWSSVMLVERYAHLLPAGQEESIKAFLSRSVAVAADDTTATPRQEKSG